MVNSSCIGNWVSSRSTGRWRSSGGSGAGSSSSSNNAALNAGPASAEVGSRNANNDSDSSGRDPKQGMREGRDLRGSKESTECFLSADDDDTGVDTAGDKDEDKDDDMGGDMGGDTSPPHVEHVRSCRYGFRLWASAAIEAGPREKNCAST